MAIQWLPDIFAEFQAEYPGIEYEVLMGDYDEVERWIDEGRVDYGFLSLPVKNTFDTISLKMDEYKVVLRMNHPLAARDKIDVKILENQPFMLLEHGGRTGTDYRRRWLIFWRK